MIYIIQPLQQMCPQFEPPPFFKRVGGGGEGVGGIDLTKNPKKGEGGMQKLLKGRGDPKKGGFCRKGGDTFSMGIFSSWGVVNVTTVTFNQILVIVFLFPLNVGVSPCFHCTMYSFSSYLQDVYFLYTSCFHNTVVSSCYRLHTSVRIIQVLLLV